MKVERILDLQDTLESKENNDHKFYACSANISIFYPTDENEQIITQTQNDSEEDFKKYSFLKVDFRTDYQSEN